MKKEIHILIYFIVTSPKLWFFKVVSSIQIQHTLHKYSTNFSQTPGIFLGTCHKNKNEETENQRNNITVKYCIVNWDPDPRLLGGNYGHLCWNLKVCSGFVCGNAFLTCSLRAQTLTSKSVIPSPPSFPELLIRRSWMIKSVTFPKDRVMCDYDSLMQITSKQLRI